MSEKRKNILLLAVAFLAGVVITAIVAFVIVGRQAPTVQQGPDTSDVAAAKTIDYAATFPSWNQDSASLRELVDFVSGSTDESGSGYLKPEDRIVVFDMDGTLLCEKAPVYIDYCLTMYRVLDDPSYNATEEERNAMQQIRDHAYSEGETFHPEGLTKDDLVASAFAGMTPEEFRAYVVNFADTVDVVGFDGMTYSQSFYLPMMEVVKYLQANDFDVWMVSACEREVVRALVERCGIPYDHVIATDVPYVASGKGDEPADGYNMSRDEEILLGAPLDEVECGKSEKSAAIAREIGKRPVLAFGNSAGDYSMLNYAEGNNGIGFFVVCDDTEREYGSAEKAAKYYDEVEKEGWTAFSMANDWKTIYGDGVQKTELPGNGIDNQSTLDTIKTSGVLRVGTAGDYQPMSYLDPETGSYVGFDAELAEDLAAALGVKIEYVKTSWPTLMEDTLAGKFDLAICGITITDARKEQALMSDGYLENGKTVLCRAEDADGYTSLDAINRPEVRVMENPGGLNEKFARENLPNATLIIHDVNQEIPGLVASGKADVMITEIMEAGFYVGQDDRLAAPLIYEPFTNGELGVLMPKGSEDLLDYVNEFLANEKKTGRIDELAEEYFYKYIDVLEPAA